MIGAMFVLLVIFFPMLWLTLQSIDRRLKSLERIPDNAVTFISPVDSITNHLADYGHFIGVAVKKGSKRNAWMMSRETAELFKAAIERSLKEGEK